MIEDKYTKQGRKARRSGRVQAEARTQEILSQPDHWAHTVVHEREGIVLETLHRKGHVPPDVLVYDNSDD